MSSRMSTRTKVVLIGAVTAVAAMFGGVAMTLFTDSADTTVYVKTGNVDISATEKVEVTNLLPGVPQSKPILFDNSASSAPVAVSLGTVSSVQVSNPDASLKLLTVSIVDADGKVILKPTSLDKLKLSDLKVVVLAGQKWNGTVVIALSKLAGNEWQNVSLSCVLTLVGTQVLPT